MQGHRILQEVNYSLLPAFYDGFLEAMQRGGCLVDGYEYSYGYKKREEFADAYTQIHKTSLRFTGSPDLYRTRVRAGFGLWIDRDQKFDYFSPQEFKNALRNALEVSDRYVWIYGQSLLFFPPSRIPSTFIDAMAAARREIRN